MLYITIPEREYFNEKDQSFFTIKEQTLQLEHSLVSVSKWESKWKKPFFLKEPKTRKETIDYIKCMTITQNVNDIVYKGLTDDNLDEIYKYIEDPMTATWFKNKSRGVNRQVITSEIIYYWMVYYNIPVEFQKWHINRLLTLIRVCDEKNAPAKKMNRKEQLSSRQALNAARRKQYSSNG